MTWTGQSPVQPANPSDYQALTLKIWCRRIGPVNGLQPLTAEQLQLAWKIHAKVEDLLEAGSDDMTIFKEMCDFMPQFKRLLDGSRQQRGVMDELCRRYAGFYRYATILETVAAGIASGEIKVPK
jgi:hypothetical protein